MRIASGIVFWAATLVPGAAAWADGLAGTTLDLDVDKQNELFVVARTAWAEAGKPKPHLATSFWFALGSVGRCPAKSRRRHRNNGRGIAPNVRRRPLTGEPLSATGGSLPE